MFKHFLFFALTLSLAFSMVGQECPQVLERCIQNACVHAKGELTEEGICSMGPEFDTESYESGLAACNYTFEYCIENDGLVHNMSCCGPIFILLGALALIAKHAK